MRGFFFGARGHSTGAFEPARAGRSQSRESLTRGVSSRRGAGPGGPFGADFVEFVFIFELSGEDEEVAGAGEGDVEEAQVLQRGSGAGLLGVDGGGEGGTG